MLSKHTLIIYSHFLFYTKWWWVFYNFRFLLGMTSLLNDHIAKRNEDWYDVIIYMCKLTQFLYLYQMTSFLLKMFWKHSMKLVYNAELAFVTFSNLVLANNNTFQCEFILVISTQKYSYQYRPATYKWIEMWMGLAVPAFMK